MSSLGRQSGVLRYHGMDMDTDTASATLILATTEDGNLPPPFLVIKVRSEAFIHTYVTFICTLQKCILLIIQELHVRVGLNKNSKLSLVNSFLIV